MKILVVDDSDVDRMVVKKFLQGNNIVEANSGDAAINAFGEAHDEKEPFQLIIIDLHMPGTDGLTAIKAIRDYEDRNHLYDSEAKIIVISGTESTKETMAAFRLGCEIFIHKPVRKADLLEKIAELDFS